MDDKTSEEIAAQIEMQMADEAGAAMIAAREKEKVILADPTILRAIHGMSDQPVNLKNFLYLLEGEVLQLTIYYTRMDTIIASIGLPRVKRMEFPKITSNSTAIARIAHLEQVIKIINEGLEQYTTALANFLE